jgi:hypothetical protein
MSLELVGYHSSNSKDFMPGPFLHVGSLEQALMRGRPYLFKIRFKIPMRMKKIKDEGSWNRVKLMTYLRKSPVIEYVNRYEGIDFSGSEKNIDELTDSQFIKRFPQAKKSWIILDTDFIQEVIEVDRQAPRD